MISMRYKNDGKTYRRLTVGQKNAIRIFGQKCSNGVYTFEKYDCECGCTYEEMELLSEKERFGLNVETRICPRCGLIMANPRMTQESYNDFYDRLYVHMFRENNTPTEDYYRESNKHGKQILSYMEKNHPLLKGEKILEIGTAGGGILEGIKLERPNILETGIDLGGEYIKGGKERGLNLYQMSSKQLHKNGEKFDFIILSHVLEHMLDLEEELGIISELLNSNGILYVEVPGLYDIRDNNRDFLEYLTLPHVRYFSLGTLKNVMAKYGFEMVSGDQYIHSLWRYTGNLDKDTHENYYDANMSFIRKLENDNKSLYCRKELKRKYKVVTDFIRIRLLRMRE